MRLKKIIFIFLFIPLILTSACSDTSQFPVTEETLLLDTLVRITVYSYDGDTPVNTLISDCFEYCREYENKYSRTIPTSLISKINNAGGEPVEIDSEAKALFEKSIFYSEKTNGAFDITIAPVSSLWDFHSENPAPPEKNTIEENLIHVDYNNIILTDSAITLKDPQSAIDLGGIAKGFIADKAKEYLVSRGVSSAILDFGGNIVAIGSNPNGSDFVIGLKYTMDMTAENTVPDKIYINDKAVATSSSYERTFDYNGKKYHHILDTYTGYPVDNDLISVTVTADKSVDADALSTSCFILGVEKSRELINSVPNTEVLFVTGGNKKDRIKIKSQENTD